MKIFKKIGFFKFFKTNCIFYVKFAFRMFPAFIWCTYCPCKSKIMNFQKSLYRKWANFGGQTRLLRCHLTTQLCNLGWWSKALEVDKDASFHLRHFMKDLHANYGHRSTINRSGRIPPPPPVFRQTKCSGRFRVKYSLQ